MTLLPELSSLESYGLQRPRIGTQRSPDRPSVGGQQAVIAQLAGYDPLPWQELVWSTAGERSRSRWAHPEVGLIAARQKGKTAVITARAGWGLFVKGRAHPAQRAKPEPTAGGVRSAGTNWLRAHSPSDSRREKG